MHYIIWVQTDFVYSSILEVVSTCFDNVEMKILTGLLLLNLNKAFDSVQLKILLQTLQLYGKLLEVL